jgi:acetylglutamate kinase
MATSGIASGGMIPKIEASLRALTTTQVVHIIDGRISHALLDNIGGQAQQTQSRGTTIVAE